MIAAVVRCLGVVALLVSPAACLSGPSAALGGGPIGRTPDLRANQLLADPDSTRGQGFVLVSNRRDFLEEARVELNAAARAYERLLGVEPPHGDIRLTSSADSVEVRVTFAGRTPPPVTVAIAGGGRGRMRGTEVVRVARTVVLFMSREWLTHYIDTHGGNAGTGWMAETRIAPWLRIGLLQSVAETPVHEFWLMQLGRQRDSIPSVARLMAPDACAASCLASFAGARDSDGAAAEMAATGDGGDARRLRLDRFDDTIGFAAASYALVQFFFRREGAPFLRTQVGAALTGSDPATALATARSFTADPADIDRQWRVWLASYAYRDGR